MLRGARGGSQNRRGQRGGSRGRGQSRTVIMDGPSEGGIRKPGQRGRGGRGRGGGGGRGGGRGYPQNSRGRRGGRGGGRGPRGRGRGSTGKPQSKEDLDADMESYWNKDAKKGGAHLDNDLDDYFANRQTKDDEGEGGDEGAAEAAAEGDNPE